LESNKSDEVSIFYGSFIRFLTLFLDIFTVFGITGNDKNLEIILLRQQIRIPQRNTKTPPRKSDPEKMIPASLTYKIRRSLKKASQQRHRMMLIFKPGTIFGWHRELVRRKWRFKRKGKPGRPGINSELEEWAVRLANENPRWGYEKIQGELIKLGNQLSVSSVLGTRRIHLAGCTSNPNQIWVSQQARQLVWELKDQAPSKQAFLIHDHDSKFTSSFDTVFSSEGIDVIHTPYQAPRANAYPERWVRSAREERLDHLLILNENHLRRVLQEYVTDYNHERPHQGIHPHFPRSGPVRPTRGPIRSQDILGGNIHNYYRQPSASVPGTG
jgi:putative transposase